LGTKLATGKTERKVKEMKRGKEWNGPYTKKTDEFIFV
jgi:hypothetical protein